MKPSICYNLAFLDAVLRFADDQIETQSNSDETGPSPEQELRATQSFMVLCDMIDIYCERQVEAAHSARLKQPE